LSPTSLVYEIRIRLLHVLPDPEQVGDREVFRREPPRCAWERLAEEVGGVRWQGGEEDAVGEQGVEEAAHHGQHAVAKAVEGEPDDVAALGAVGAVARPELLDGLVV
jgi:hypothetical protein